MFCGFLRMVAVALIVLAPPVPPVANGPFPFTPLLRIPPSTPVPAAADWASAKMLVAEELPESVRLAETGIRVWDKELPEARRAANEVEASDPDAEPALPVTEAEIPAVPVFAAALLPVAGVLPV